MKKLILLALVALSSLAAEAQFSASFNTSANFSRFAVGYEITDRVWSDVRFYTGTSFEDIIVEPTVAFNYVTNSSYDLYVGAAASVNQVRPVCMLPIGVRIKPLEKLQNLMLTIEAEPTLNYESENLYIFGSVGVKYVFGGGKAAK